MRAVIQRVSKAQVAVDGEVVGRIGKGYVILLGVSEDDTEEDAQYLAEKCAFLRVFNDEQGKMNLSLADVGGSILSISQFTLYADCRKGRRPSFIQAARPEKGEALYERFNTIIRSYGITVETGIFGAMMDVDIYNQGPVTIIINSKEEK